MLKILNSPGYFAIEIEGVRAYYDISSGGPRRCLQPIEVEFTDGDVEPKIQDMVDRIMQRTVSVFRFSNVPKSSKKGVEYVAQSIRWIRSQELSRTLKILSCGMQFVPFVIQLFLHVEELDLSGNDLRWLPPELVLMSQLKVLDVSRNPSLSELPDEPPSKLERVDITGTAILSTRRWVDHKITFVCGAAKLLRGEDVDGSLLDSSEFQQLDRQSDACLSWGFEGR